MAHQLLHVRTAVASFGLLSLTLLPLHAGGAPVLTLDDPNPIISVPSSGSIFHNFGGTLSFSLGFEFDGATLLFPFINGASPGLTSGEFLNIPYSDAADGGTFAGDLFRYQIGSAATLGFYNEEFGGGPATLEVRSHNAAGAIETVSAPYTITLVAASAVPEPSSLVLLAVGSVMLFAAGGVHRRRWKSIYA